MIYGDGTLSTTTPTLDANSSSASITYQWQYSVASAPTTWINITGAESSSLVTATVQSLSILENTSIRRVSYAQIGTVKCEIPNATYPKIDIEVENIDGGLISPNLLYTCDVVGSTYTISVADTSFGNINYQWQSATTNVSSSFTDISGEIGPSLIVSTNVTATTYYRRITESVTSGSSCSTAYSNVFEFVLNSIDPGTLPEVSGLYCEGSTPPVLGQSSVVTSTYPITYQWYKGETNDLTSVTSSTWQAIPLTNSNIYSPPALSSSFRYVLYRRGVIENRGGSSTCEKYTDYVSFELFDTLDIGYIEPATGTPDFPYCVGDRFPDLRLISADPNITDNSNYSITATWEMSTDGINWTTVSDVDINETTFNRRIEDSNNPSDPFYLADDLYFRVKVVNPNTSISTNTLEGYSVQLVENSAPHDIGDSYKITIGSTSVAIPVTASVSTTDDIGEALASKINSDITAYTAIYLPEGNIIQIFDTASNALEISASVSYTLNQTLQLNVLKAFNNNTTDNCTYYTSVYKIDVVDRPTIDLDGGASSQEVCDGTSISPIPISWTGSSSILITGLDPGLTVNVGSGTEQTIGGNKLITGTDSITITGTPISDNTFNVRLNSFCRNDSDINVQYRITKISSPADICFLFRDSVDNWQKTIFYDVDGKGHYNSVCVDSSVSPSNTLSLTTTNIYAGFNETASSYGGYLDWDFIDRDGVSSVSPTLSNTPLVDTSNSIEKGTQITWNPSFLASTTLTGAWVTIRVRSSSTCSATLFSNWSSTDVWVVKTDNVSQTAISPDLPVLTKPTALNLSHSCSGWGGYNSGDIPSCEVLNSTYTQFFSAALTGTNDFGELEWEITDPSAGTINSNGVVTWTPGFYGNVRVRVRPVSCDDTSSSSDWIESDVITISPVNELIPNLTRTDLPTCPIPTTGSQTSTIESDIPVDWYIKTSSTGVATSSFLRTGSVTFTGSQYLAQDYYQIESNTNTGGLQLPWANSVSGTVYLKAVPQGCSGTEPEWVRDFTIRIPQNPRLEIASNNIGTINPEICENDTDFNDIIYNVIGRSVTGISINETTNQISGSLLDVVIVPKSQVTTVTFNDTTNILLERYIIININEIDYKILATVGESSDSVGSKLAALIDGDSNLSANYNSTTNKLLITGTPGYFYTIYTSNSSSRITLTVDFNVDNQVYSQVEVRGVTGYIAPGDYIFSVDLTLDPGCVQSGQVLINLRVNSDAELTLTSSGTTLNQDVCYNEAIETIQWSISGLANLSNVNVIGILPRNIQSTKTSTTFSLTNNGASTNYWNTRVFPFTIETDGNVCDEASQSGSITVYPNDYLRKDPSDTSISQVLCEGEAIIPVSYEFWGVDSISATIQDNNTLGLTTSITTRTQLASITFNSLLGQTSTDTTEFYSIYINDEVYTVTASAVTNYDASELLNLLSNTISSSVATATVEGDFLVLTGQTSGTTFALEGRSSNGSNFTFGQPTLSRAPRVITITGTPTLSSTTTLTTRGEYEISILTQTGAPCATSATSSLTYTLLIDPLTKIWVTSTNSNLEVCDGFATESIDFQLSGTDTFQISAIASPSDEITYHPEFGSGKTFTSADFGFPGSTNFEVNWIPNATTGITTKTIFTYTVTATTNACGTSDFSTVTGTFTMYPHYLNRIPSSGQLSQEVFENNVINPIEFDFSADYSDLSIVWPGGDDLGLTLTISGTSATLSGTVTPLSNFTTSTSYQYVLTLDSKANLSSNCNALTVTGTILVNSIITLTNTGSATVVDQVIYDGDSIDPVELLISAPNQGFSYIIEWKDNLGNTLQTTPGNLSIEAHPSYSNISSLTLSGELVLPSSVQTPTSYYYRISTVTSTAGIEPAIFEGRIVAYPKEEITTSVNTLTVICQNEEVDFSFDFVGIKNLTFTASPSLPIGLDYAFNYTTTPTFEIDVVSSSTALGEVFQIEFLGENASQTFSFVTSTTTTSSATIAEYLGDAINDSRLNVNVTGSTITIEAVDPNFVFTLKENQPYTPGSFVSVFNSKLRINEIYPVTGSLIVSGTITTQLTTTTLVSITLETPGINTASDSETISLYIEPNHIITASDTNLLTQTICDSSALTEINFTLSEGATNYLPIVWTNGKPPGIVASVINSVSRTFTLSGTVETGVTTTVSYPYIITTDGNSCNPAATISGTIIVEPKHYLAYSGSSGDGNQNVCDLSSINPIEFEISGGATGVSVAWTNGNPGLTVFLSNNSSTTYIISGTLNTGITTETTYPYTITTQGNGCATASLTGEITVIPQLVINVDTPLTQNQIGSNALCNGDDIEAIEFSFTSGNSPTFLEVVWTDSEGTTIQTPGPTLNGYSLTGPISTSSTELTTYYYTVNAKDTNASCVFTAEFSGTIQVSPEINVYQEYIQNNDVTDVSCTGNSDGSIIINATTAAEFALRIDGGQVAQAQIDKVTLSVSDTLNAGDQISVLIDGITFTSVVASGTTTQTMLEELRDKVNFGTGSAAVNVTAAVVNDGSEIYLQLVADTAGTAFVASGTTITSTVTGTTVVSTTVENKNLNYEYTWTKDGVFRGSSLNLENLEAGTYTLAVSINGCDASTTYDFVVQEPTITLGTVSETCNGDISIPITAILTASQLSIAGDKITAELYERGVDNAYSVLFGTQSFATAQSSNSFVANFYNLTQGETYQLVVTDNTCNERTTLEIGPLNTEITINVNSITTTDEECYGEGGTLAMALGAISNGSGYYSYEWTNLSTGSKYNTRNVTGADAGLYELTVTDQNYGCEVTTTGIIEIEAVVTDLTVAWSAASPITNDCYDSREGILEVVETGGSGDFFYEWYFTPQTSSVTLLLNNDSSILEVDNVIPASYYAGGEYYVLVYDGGGTASCASSGTKGNPFVIINPEELSFATASSTISNIACAGDESGSIYVEVAGGSGNYLYTINGGVPYIPSTGVISENNLAAGNYTLIVEDADNSCGTALQITQAITISEPAGGALTLALGEVAEIPCDGGLGSIEIEISGGSPLTSNSASSVIDYYSVKVVRQGGGFTLNTTHDPSNTSLVIENLTTAGTYDITVSDTNGCTETLTNILLNNSSNGLAATGVITQATGCNEVSLTEGATITVNWPDRGDGNNGGYPLWQQRTSVNLDSFTIALNGTVTGVDVSTLGVAITTTTSATVFASSTASTTFSSVQDVAAQLAYNINLISDLTATLNGSTIIVKGLIIGSASALTSSASTLNISVSGISQVADTKWSDVPGMAGMEVISGLSAGYYRAIINDSSGCGGTLVQNSSQGGSIFQIDEPQSLQFASIVFDEVTCNQPTSNLQFKLSNGVYTYSPDPSAFEFTLNSVLLTSTVEGSVSFTTGTTTTSLSSTTSATTSSATTSSATTSAAASVVGSTYTPNLRTNTVEIKNLIPGNYELVVENIQTECIAVLNFTINDASSITYSGETNFDIDPCYETYQELFFDQFLIDGGEPFQSSDGESFYSLKWTFDPSDPDENTSTISSLSNNVNFAPRAGTYELLIYDSNGCTILDENGLETPIEFTFSQSLTSLQVLPAGGANGDEFATPVSCEIGAEDGQINIDVESSDPYEIKWHVQQSTTSANEQRLLFQGISAAVDSLEVYAIRINDIPISYSTQQSNEPITSVVNEFAQRINDNALFTASVDPTENPNEIIVKSASNAAIDLEIVSQSTRLLMINSSSNGATWVALDGTNGYPNYTGYLSLNSLAEGQYRYTISAVNVANCDNGAEPSSVQGIITVENENILEIREGPIVDDYLCNGQSGTLFIDVFDGNTGPLSFFYNSTPVTYEVVGTNQYIINIDNPVETATLEIYNAANCGLSREINIGNGTPLFEFNSVNFLQSGTFLAREDITFIDNSENEYDSFEFVFGDGTQTDVLERNTPEPITHEYAISGTYYVTLRIYNDLGCSEELTKLIKIGKGYSILVPNVFSPNGDIWNNTFRPIFNGLSEIILRVYDAQGGLLYEEAGAEGSDPDKLGLSLRGWEGNKNLPSSPYFIYTITAKTIDDEPVFRDGTFILLQ